MILDGSTTMSASLPDLSPDQHSQVPGSLNALSAPSRSPSVFSDTNQYLESNVCGSPECDDSVVFRKRPSSTDFDVPDSKSCYVADEMGDDQRAEKCIMDIPYSVLLRVYQSLDADKGWERLAAETHFTFDQIRLLDLEQVRSQGSPSRSLLWELSSRNTTVRQLHGYLLKLHRFREVRMLEEYVNCPPKPVAFDNGIKGLKPPDVSMESSKSKCDVYGQKSSCSSMAMSSKKSDSDNYDINFNQNVSGLDFNSLKSQEKANHYIGKLMPTSPQPANPPNPSSDGANAAGACGLAMQVPQMKPVNPTRTVNPSSGAHLLQSMISQMPKQPSGAGSQSNSVSSNSSNNTNTPRAQASSSSSSQSSPSASAMSDLSGSSNLSLLPGLENSLEIQMAFIGSACFSYADVVQATNNFSERNKLGEGAFGSVYFGILRQNQCAVKKMFEANGQETVVERSTQIKRELTSLLKFRHENIVTLYGYAVDGEALCLIYQYMPNGSLEDRILCKNNTAPLGWSQRVNIILGACQGLNFLHTMGEQSLIHGDIKSANILLDKYMEAKIGDLGLAQQASGRDAESNTLRMTHITRAQSSSKLYGTRAYQPQEVQTGGKPSTKGDIFAMGVVLLELFSGEKAYDERREDEKFLADYFLALKSESGEGACLSKVDRRGGACDPEVASCILAVANMCISRLKRGRPTSIQLLQKVKDIHDLNAQKTGIKVPSMDSLPGSELSCHVSHSSSADSSVNNLAAAPTPPASSLHSAPQQHHHHHNNHHQPSPSRPPSHTKGYGVNLNNDSPDSPAEKDYNRHLHQPQHKQQPQREEKHPDNRLVVNIKSDPPTASFSRREVSPQRADHLEHPPQVSEGESSPINYFRQGQRLPPPFILQQAYDKMSPEERKRISRISDCYSTIVDPDQGAEPRQGAGPNVEVEVLPQADPAKLEALEQFDRSNIGGGRGERDSSTNSLTLRSDPKKLAALKFDDEQSCPSSSEVENVGGARTSSNDGRAGNLRCDSRKLAYLTQFDETNLQGGDNSRSTMHREQGDALVAASDPRKLEALTRFDTANTNSSAAPPSTQQHRQKSCLESEEESSLVSQMDYVVLSSQQEALDVCSSSLHQQGEPQHSNLPYCSMNATHQAAPVTDTRTPPDSSPASLAEDGNSSASLSENLLLQRQRNFFDMYTRALEGMEDDSGEEENATGEDYGEAHLQQNCNSGSSQGHTNNSGGAGGKDFPPVSSDPTRSVSGVGDYHPRASEQDETLLNYYKERLQHCEKVYKKSHS